MRSREDGWTLVVLVVLLTVALIAIVGVGTAVAEGMRVSLLRVNEAKAAYLAQAGVMDAIRAFEQGTDRSWALGEHQVTAPLKEVFIRLSTLPQRDFLFVDMVPASWQILGGQSRLRNWTLRNTRTIGSGTPPAGSLTVTGMRVEWTGVAPPGGGACALPAECVTSVIFGSGMLSCPADWFGSAWAGQVIDVPDCVLSSNTAQVTSNQIRWNTTAVAARGADVTITFIMSDAGSCVPVSSAAESNPLLEHCQRTVRFLNAGPNVGLLTVRSIGEARYLPFAYNRAVRAEYRDTSSSAGAAPPDRIISWVEED